MDLPLPNDTAVPVEQAEQSPDFAGMVATFAAPIAHAVSVPVDPATIAPTLPEKGGKGGEGGDEAVPPLPPSIAPMRESVRVPAAEFVADGVFTPAPSSNLVIARLREQGWYCEALGDGKHTLECPWSPDHQGAPSGPAIYTEPTTRQPYGRFQCPQGHADRANIHALLDRLEIEPQRARGKPLIRLVAGEQNLILAAAEHVLTSCDGFYQTSGTIVQLRRSAGEDLHTELANEQILAMALSGTSDWEKYDGRSKAWIRCDPPVRTCQMLLKSTERGSLPPLNGIARQPFFRKSDGALVATPGYDPQSGIYAQFRAEAYDLPEPSRAAAEQALVRLLELTSEFHFASEVDQAALLCAMLTATVRTSLPQAPAFNVTAASPGSGKSYASRLAVSFATAGEPLNMSYPTSSEEASKAMLAALIQAPAAIAFDDMQTDWLPYGVINRLLTSDTISERVLGSSRVVTAGTNCFIIGSGNNIGPVRDMCRRVVSIRLAPPTSAPATLKYEGTPVETVRANREAYVSDALTIIRSWRAAGAPKADVPTIGSFGEWSDQCRQPLLWLGLPDPALSLVEQVLNDPDATALSALMEAWSHEFGTSAVTVRRVVRAAELYPDQALAEALYNLPVMDNHAVNPSKLGWYLRRNMERQVDGYMIRQVQASERLAWTVIRVT